MFQTLLSRRQPGGRHNGLGCLAACLCAIALLAGLPAQAAGRLAGRPTLAILYDRADEYAPNAFQQVLDGIRTHPDIAVFRVALNDPPSGSLAVAAAAAPQQGGFIKLAAYTGGNIAVLYPDIGEPYRSVFSKIIEGIEDKAKVRVASYPIGGGTRPEELAGELRRQNVRVVIALGRNGLKAASSLERGSVAIVAGGVLTVPESEMRGMAVYSLAPDPELLFARLKVLVPQVRRVYVVYDPRQNAWLLQLARAAARSQGLELVPREAQDLRAAMQQYQALLAGLDPRSDALWLPQDSTTVEESAVLPLVLQEAWNRNIAVFSSSLGHVKRGILFSLYPNNLELGRNLASSALGRLASNADADGGMVPLKDVLIAVNLRTAGHLGLNIGASQRFDLVFPEP
ncbi:ABC transporter substrate-binding protein [Chitinimonas koreensis]|uniref:ABC transporter substrate-binding protein n=1 Tax=Chitinimonas koreensis TaxID=356302 RepID=UPI000422A2BE|nr:ABC transporter substrate binding protein [Chitinimonas koreensis]